MLRRYILLPVIIGIGVGLSAILLPLTVALGGLISGLLTYYLSPESAGSERTRR